MAEVCRGVDELLISAYEVARLKNIARNNAVLESLGLLKDSKTSLTPSIKPKKKRKAKPDTNKSERQPSRRSKRLKGEKPEGTTFSLPRVKEIDEIDEIEENDKFVRWKIERLKAEHTKHGTTYKNPTATYEHTWMRVRTMTKNRLKTRIKVIERALGKHCIIKMRMFAEVLIIAGMDEVAALANAALDRLIALTGSHQIERKATS